MQGRDPGGYGEGPMLLPGEYWSRSQGERDLIWALASHEANERRAAPRKGPPITKRKK